MNSLPDFWTQIILPTAIGVVLTVLLLTGIKALRWLFTRDFPWYGLAAGACLAPATFAFHQAMIQQDSGMPPRFNIYGEQPHVVDGAIKQWQMEAEYRERRYSLSQEPSKALIPTYVAWPLLAFLLAAGVCCAGMSTAADRRDFGWQKWER